MTDAVARLTPLGLMILALLGEDDMHPYEMMRLMRRRSDDRIVRIQNGTFYHTVDRLERAGLISEVGVDRAGKRPERTTYALTDSGRVAVAEWVRRELPRIDRPADFRVALAEAHNLDRGEAVLLLRERRAALAESASAAAAGVRAARGRGVHEQFLIERDREQALNEAELAWLDRLLPRLESDEFVWGTADLPRTERYLAEREAARR